MGGIEEVGTVAGFFRQFRINVHQSGGVADAFAQNSVGFGIRAFLFLGHMGNCNEIGFIVAVFVLKRAGAGESTACFVRDLRAGGFCLFTLQLDGFEGDGLALVLNGRGYRHGSLFLHVFRRNGALNLIGHLSAFVFKVFVG